MSGSHEVSRRDFAKVVSAILGTLVGAGIGLPAIGYLISPATKIRKTEEWLPLGTASLVPLNQPTPFNFTRAKVNGWEQSVQSYTVYVLRQEGDTFTALSNVCPHASCRVNWNGDKQVYICPCHDAHFNPEGGILSGPPPRPLDAFQTKIEDDTLYIFFREG